MIELHPCPVCGSLTLGAMGDYEICDACGWEDDPAQSADPDLSGGANEQSLREAQATWQRREKLRAAALEKPSQPAPTPHATRQRRPK